MKLQLKQEVIRKRCHLCGYIFSKRSHMLRHLREQHQAETQTNDENPMNTLSTIDDNSNLKDLIISLKNELKELKETQITTNHNVEELKETQIATNHNVEETHQQVKELRESIEQVEEKQKEPQLIVNHKHKHKHNHLQIVCVTSDDNYLDMLTDSLGDFGKALQYVKSCGLADINGDCRLIEKIYLNPENAQPSFYYIDNKRTQIEYFDENEELVVTKKEIFGRKLADNLQKTYLKSVNWVINNNLDNRLCPNKMLEEYDLQTWNQHIYHLSDQSYQRALMNQLDIPIKPRRSSK
jgi:hypothetical protein